jgi:hypothetical protein
METCCVPFSYEYIETEYTSIIHMNFSHSTSFPFFSICTFEASNYLANFSLPPPR